MSTVSNRDICVLCDKLRFEHTDHMLCTNVVESVLGLQQFVPVNNMERMLAKKLAECQRERDANLREAAWQEEQKLSAQQQLQRMTKALRKLPDAFAENFYARHDHKYSGLTVKNWLRDFSARALLSGKGE